MEEELEMKDYSSSCESTCLNCGYIYKQSEGQSRANYSSFVTTKHTSCNTAEFEVQIVDAIYYIFGLSLKDIYPENHCTNQYAEVLALCSECTPLLHKLYDCFKDFKKMSNNHSLLWTSIELKRNKATVKQELSSEQNEYFPTLGVIDPSVGNLQNEPVNIYNNNNHQFYNQDNAESLLISGNIFEDNFGIDPNSDSTYFFDQDNVEHTKIDNDQVVDLKFLETSSHPKQNKKSKFKDNDKCIRTDTSFAGNRKIKRLRKQKRFTALSEEYLKWKVAHLDSLERVVPIKCCSVPFQSEVDFMSHIRDSHENESEKLEEACGICKRMILSKYMDFHTKVLHQDLSAFECSVCQKSFSSKSQARKHRQKNHKKIRSRREGTRIFCEECKKYFEYAYFHRYHKPVIHRKDDKKFNCTFCGSVLNSELYLKTHIHLYHTENTSKVCDVCGKIFPNQYNLSRHKRIHEADVITDKEKFKCTQCGITLKHSLSLRKHMYLMHGKAALKVFTCEICGKTTKNWTNLRLHMKIHDPNRTKKQKTPIVKNNENVVKRIKRQKMPTVKNNENVVKRTKKEKTTVKNHETVVSDAPTIVILEPVEGSIIQNTQEVLIAIQFE